jgi:hypothetical protein
MVDNTGAHTGDEYEYSVKSTPLGGAVVFQLGTTHHWWNNGSTSDTTVHDTRVYLHGKLLANMSWNSAQPTASSHQVNWTHVDPMANSVGRSQLLSGGNYQGISAQLDPTGAEIGTPPESPNPLEAPSSRWEFGSPEAVDWITIDGVTAPANHFPPGLVAAASRCPNGDCGPIKTRNGWEWWNAFADGYEGYMPMGAHYAGSGMWSWQTERQRRPARRQNTKPTLKNATKKSKAEVAQKRDLAATGIFDSEANGLDFSIVDPPENGSMIPFIFKVTALFLRKVRTVGLTETQSTDVYRRLAFMVLSIDCVKAFRSAGLSTPAEMIRDRGLVIADSNLLMSRDNNERLGISNDFRRELITHRKFGSDGFTSSEGGAVYTFFNFWPSPNFPFSESFVHERIHGSNVGSHYSYWSYPFPFYGHDLTAYEHYQNILDNCRLPEGTQ